MAKKTQQVHRGRAAPKRRPKPIPRPETLDVAHWPEPWDPKQARMAAAKAEARGMFGSPEPGAGPSAQPWNDPAVRAEAASLRQPKMAPQGGAMVRQGAIGLAPQPPSGGGGTLIAERVSPMDAGHLGSYDPGRSLAPGRSAGARPAQEISLPSASTPRMLPPGPMPGPQSGEWPPPGLPASRPFVPPPAGAPQARPAVPRMAPDPRLVNEGPFPRTPVQPSVEVPENWPMPGLPAQPGPPPPRSFGSGDIVRTAKTRGAPMSSDFARPAPLASSPAAETRLGRAPGGGFNPAGFGSSVPIGGQPVPAPGGGFSPSGFGSSVPLGGKSIPPPLPAVLPQAQAGGGFMQGLKGASRGAMGFLGKAAQFDALGSAAGNAYELAAGPDRVGAALGLGADALGYFGGAPGAAARLLLDPAAVSPDDPADFTPPAWSPAKGLGPNLTQRPTGPWSPPPSAPGQGAPRPGETSVAAGPSPLAGRAGGTSYRTDPFARMNRMDYGPSGDPYVGIAQALLGPGAQPDQIQAFIDRAKKQPPSMAMGGSPFDPRDVAGRLPRR